MWSDSISQHDQRKPTGAPYRGLTSPVSNEYNRQPPYRREPSGFLGPYQGQSNYLCFITYKLKTSVRKKCKHIINV